MTLGNEGTEPLAPEPATPANLPAEEMPEGPEPQEPGPDDVDETEEIDWEDGKKYRVPKPLKDGFLRTKDYTQKTQAVAAERKAIEAQRAALEADTAARKEHIKEVARLQAYDDWLSQADQVDWATFNQDDPIAAQSAWMQREQAKDARAKLATKLEADVKASTEKAQQGTVTRLQETRDFAAKNIPGWSPEMDIQIGEFARTELGFTQDEIMSFLNPKTYRTLHRLWSVETAARRNPNPPPRTEPEPVTPLAKPPSGRAPASSGPSDRQPISDWMKMRNKQVAGRR